MSKYSIHNLSQETLAVNLFVYIWWFKYGVTRSSDTNGEEGVDEMIAEIDRKRRAVVGSGRMVHASAEADRQTASGDLATIGSLTDLSPSFGYVPGSMSKFVANLDVVRSQ
ncbi:unnamed protein product [Calicophoron daubneyi]|uniref:Uncharacterized protein n=1 Tax=Calicophoron daubneyi TaxID=300641 RepID=A0AAV2T6Z9_CALDB